MTNDEYNSFVEAIPLYTRFGQQARLLQFSFRALVETLASTGMRISEALSLNRDSLDYSNGESMVIGKGDKQRTVFFTERALEWIRRYHALRNDRDESLFAGVNGRRLQVFSVHALFKRTNKKVEQSIRKHVTPHILRHTAATNLLQRGCPIGHIKEILGHQNLETTCRFYLGQLTKNEVKKAFDTYMHYEIPANERLISTRNG